MKKLLIIILLAPVFCFAQKDSVDNENNSILLSFGIVPQLVGKEYPSYVNDKINPFSIGLGYERKLTNKNSYWSLRSQLFYGSQYYDGNGGVFYEQTDKFSGDKRLHYQKGEYLQISISPTYNINLLNNKLYLTISSFLWFRNQFSGKDVRFLNEEISSIYSSNGTSFKYYFKNISFKNNFGVIPNIELKYNSERFSYSLCFLPIYIQASGLVKYANTSLLAFTLGCKI